MSKHMKAFERVTTVACIIATIATMVALLMVWFSPRADASEPYYYYESSHRVVLKSTYPSCPNEDGGLIPCSWNLNAGDGNGVGLSYVFDYSGHMTYVWSEDPVRLSAGKWRWVPGKMRQRIAQEGLSLSVSCMWRTVGDDYSRIRCASGRTYMVNW